MALLRSASIAVAVLALAGCAAQTQPTAAPTAAAVVLPTSNTSGSDWLLLQEVDSGMKYIPVVQVATTTDEWNAVWKSVDPTDLPPEVDLSESIVVAFMHVHGNDCQNVSLDDVVIDAPNKVVYSEATARGDNGTTDCTNDQAGVAIFVVSIDRSALPASPFDVYLNKPTGCSGATCQRVTVNLRSPAPTHQ